MRTAASSKLSVNGRQTVVALRASSDRGVHLTFGSAHAGSAADHPVALSAPILLAPARGRTALSISRCQAQMGRGAEIASLLS
jgi:hypothetical protein